MSRLLVSVRSVDEARIALQAGVTWIDVKEPSRGSLGAANHEVLREIASVIETESPSVVLSAALGELVDSSSHSMASNEIPSNVSYAKFGLFDMGRHDDWGNAWRTAVGRFPKTCSPVMVAYADRKANSPRFVDLVIACEAAKGRFVLIDTHDKTQGNLLDHRTFDEISHWMTIARSRGLSVALAGSLSESNWDALRHLAPEVVAVRGAVCKPGRQGESSRLGMLDGERIRDWLRFVASIDTHVESGIRVRRSPVVS